MFLINQNEAVRFLHRAVVSAVFRLGRMLAMPNAYPCGTGITTLDLIPGAGGPIGRFMETTTPMVIGACMHVDPWRHKRFAEFAEEIACPLADEMRGQLAGTWPIGSDCLSLKPELPSGDFRIREVVADPSLIVRIVESYDAMNDCFMLTVGGLFSFAGGELPKPQRLAALKTERDRVLGQHLDLI